MKELKPGIIIEDAYLGVTLGALIFEHGTIYIDAPLRPEDVRAWKATLINQQGGTNRILVSLDSHVDRTLGARALDCIILAHQKTAQVFRNRPTVFKGQSSESGADWESYMESIGTRWAAPDITYTNNLSLFWGGPEIILEHHPGSASGATWVIINEEKVIFVGDAVVLDQPFFLTNADLELWIESLDLLLTKYKRYQIVSGRGGVAPFEVIKTQQKSLKKLFRNLNTLGRRNASPEATEKLIGDLLAGFKFAESKRDLYTNRLRSGLYQYYLRHCRPSNPFDNRDEESINH